jgi:hypothetical protein
MQQLGWALLAEPPQLLENGPLPTLLLEWMALKVTQGWPLGKRRKRLRKRRRGCWRAVSRMMMVTRRKVRKERNHLGKQARRWQASRLKVEGRRRATKRAGKHC